MTIDELRTAADNNDPEAQRQYAVALMTGEAVALDYAAAIAYLERSAAQDDMVSAYMLGIGNKVGDGMPVDLEKALGWFQKAGELGHPGALFELSLAYLNGRGTAADLDQGLSYMKAAATQGHAVAQRLIGQAYVGGTDGYERNPTMGAVYLRRAAEQGDSDAQGLLASLLGQGALGDPDPVEAGKWAKLAADQGHPLAAFQLGTYYLGGVGVEENPGLAVQYLRIAGEGGVAAAWLWLAEMVLSREYVNLGTDEDARNWFEQACSLDGGWASGETIRAEFPMLEQVAKLADERASVG